MPRSAFLLLAAVVLAGGCDTRPDTTVDMTPVASEIATADPTVQVALAPTEGHTASGLLTITATDDGVRMTGRVTGLPPDGEVGFHVHAIGDCSAPDASSAGDHLNPDEQPHGNPASNQHHAGDMPNLDVDADGVADVDVALDGLRIDGPTDRSLRDRAIVVHDAADDYTTQPGGASGDRVACGVIGAEPAMGADMLDAPVGAPAP